MTRNKGFPDNDRALPTHPFRDRENFVRVLPGSTDLVRPVPLPRRTQNFERMWDRKSSEQCRGDSRSGSGNARLIHARSGCDQVSVHPGAEVSDQSRASPARRTLRQERRTGSGLPARAGDSSWFRRCRRKKSRNSVGLVCPFRNQISVSVPGFAWSPDLFMLLRR